MKLKNKKNFLLRNLFSEAIFGIINIDINKNINRYAKTDEINIFNQFENIVNEVFG